MKRHITLIVAGLACIAMALPVQAAFDEPVRQALKLTVEEHIIPALGSSSIPSDKTLSVLPLAGDNGAFLEGLLGNAITKAGFSYVAAKDHPLWNEIMAEVEWDERKEDMLDPTTLVKFGKLKGTQLLMYGFVRDAYSSGNTTFVEIELHVSSLETKEHIWGDVFSKRIYSGTGVQGIVDVDDAVRNLVGELCDKQGAPSLAAAQEKFTDVKTAIVVPIAGDVKGYVTGRVKEMLATSPVTPKDLNIRTMGEAELLLRDDPGKAQGIVYGSVRDLSRELKHRRYFHGGNYMALEYEVRAEVQLAMKKHESGDILWSKTLSDTIVDMDDVTWGDLVSQYPGEIAKILGAIVGGIILLIIIFKFVGASRRAR